MGAEGPILQATIARLPDLETQLAAFGIVMSVEIAIESPVIMLLATSTALATGAHNYAVLRRFMIGINVLVTAVAAAIAFTPLYDLIVLRLIGLPGPIAAAARPGMKIMTLWSAFIGWRRFNQGVLIRRGQTRWIGIGTAIRLFGSAGVAIALGIATGWGGVPIAATGLMAGVILEALFIARAVRRTISALLAENSSVAEALSMRDVLRYHAPLAATSLLTLMAQPLIGAGLARMPRPELSLAAWPVVWGVLFIFRSPAFALPEAVIALVSSERSLTEAVRRFCRHVGVAAAVLLAAVAATPLLGFYLRHFAALPERLARFVVPGVALGVAIPFLNAYHSWWRGLLMAARSTGAIYWGMGLSLAVVALVVAGGVAARTDGIVTAVAALVVSLVVEIAYLRSRALRLE